jgi:sulfhydrogenase subunit delta
MTGTPGRPRPTLAVWKLTSCDGCQLTLLNLEDELLALADVVQIAHFTEATSASADGPYDLSLVEGSVTTPDHVERLQHVRRVSRRLVSIGACATSGGIQALRNFADVEELSSIVYAQPEHIRTLARSTPVSEHVPVDLELQGCPIDREQLLEVLLALVHERTPRFATESVCVQCKRRGTTCVMVAEGIPCLGPVTQAGCGALCPSYHRGCYGCFGPVDGARTEALAPHLTMLGMPEVVVHQVYRTFNAGAGAFQTESEAHDAQA